MSTSSRLKANLLRVLASGAEAALVPANTAVGRALVAVVAVLSFLAALAMAGAAITAGTMRDWRSDLASEATIQVRPARGRDLETDTIRAAELARQEPGILSAEPVSNAQTAQLLEPWLGQDLDLADLPVPRLVVLKLAAGAALDLAALQLRLTDAVPSATLDDHRAWITRLNRIGTAVVILAFGITVLVLVAAAAAVAFATAGAMSDNREVVDVLRLVGAHDVYIASVFQSRFWRIGLRGGLIGAGAACLAVVAAFVLSSRVSDDTDALLGTVGLDPLGYLLIAAVPAVVATIAAIVSRRTVRNYLSVS